MNKSLFAGATTLGLAVFLLLGAFGVGSDTAGVALVELGVPEHLSNYASRISSGLVLAVSIWFLVVGWRSETAGRDVTHEEFLAVKHFVEQQQSVSRKD